MAVCAAAYRDSGSFVHDPHQRSHSTLASSLFFLSVLLSSLELGVDSGHSLWADVVSEEIVPPWVSVRIIWYAWAQFTLVSKDIDVVASFITVEEI